MKVNFSDSNLEEFCTTGKSKKSAYKKYVRDGAFMRALARALSAFVYAPEHGIPKGQLLFPALRETY